jgi:hypothetical protein
MVSGFAGDLQRLAGSIQLPRDTFGELTRIARFALDAGEIVGQSFDTVQSCGEAEVVFFSGHA